MLFFITVLCVILNSVFCYEMNECVIPGKVAPQADYYWRDYVGVIPHDAVEGGYTEAGNKTYIGHFRFEEGPSILVGNIYAGKKVAVAAYNARIFHGAYVLILCSGNKNRFEWKEVNVNDMHLLNDYHIVKGGVYNTTVLYIGRASVDNQVQVGHVYPKTHSAKGLWLNQGEDDQEHLKNFQLLVLPR